MEHKEAPAQVGGTRTEPFSAEYTDLEGRKISLYGQLWIPGGEGRFPSVFLCHGFNGHYTDFPVECAALAAHGFLCCCFDFCGAQAGGKSTGRTENEYTPFTMKEDLIAAISAVKSRGDADGTVFLLGGSQGGLITALAAADEAVREQIAALLLYFPGFQIPDNWRNRPVQDTPHFGYRVGAKYIASVRDLDLFSVIGGYDGDVCIIWGDRDPLVGREYIERACKAYGEERTDLLVLEGVGHGFAGETLETVTAKVVSFFEAHVGKR